MAEGERFELSVGYKPTTVFKTVAFNRSATPPRSRACYRNMLTSQLQQVPPEPGHKADTGICVVGLSNQQTHCISACKPQSSA